LPEDLPLALVAQVHELLPAGTRVVVLGDGACDGTRLQAALPASHWSCVVRTGRHVTVTWDGEPFRCETLGACSKPGTLVALREAHVTRDAYGPVLLRCCWATDGQEPRYFLTNRADAAEACRLDAKRFRMETFCSDQKSRGLHLHRSHVADPTRLSRLCMAACLAYLWIIHLGALCEQGHQNGLIHRRHCCDLSVFPRGLRWLDYVLNEGDAIPVAFYVVL